MGREGRTRMPLLRCAVSGVARGRHVPAEMALLGVLDDDLFRLTVNALRAGAEDEDAHSVAPLRLVCARFNAMLNSLNMIQMQPLDFTW